MPAKQMDEDHGKAAGRPSRNSPSHHLLGVSQCGTLFDWPASRLAAAASSKAPPRVVLGQSDAYQFDQPL
ncbi:hypothetical protein Q1695_016060 [Nippostrongylus brasiliensis]|nr:hypothetical protein Q1695_016060 [Nippostrongylus brasiliensis]